MKRPLSLFLGMIIFFFGALLLGSSSQAQAMELRVPQVSQVPDGAWVAPWDEACEEASTVMVNGFYERKKTISKETSKQLMQRMIDWENATFKNNQDTNAEETVQLIQQFGSFNASIKRNPSLADIKAELDAQHPVIAMVDLYKFYTERSQGDSYHVFVIVGYDDKAKEFIVNDPGRDQRRYSYDRLMNALHDYNKTSKEGDGEPTVLFTSPKTTNLRSAFQHVIDFLKQLFA